MSSIPVRDSSTLNPLPRVKRVNALLKVMDFLRILRLPPTGKVHIVVYTAIHGYYASLSKLKNKIKKKLGRSENEIPIIYIYIVKSYFKP